MEHMRLFDVLYMLFNKKTSLFQNFYLFQRFLEINQKYSFYMLLEKVFPSHFSKLSQRLVPFFLYPKYKFFSFLWFLFEATKGLSSRIPFFQIFFPWEESTDMKYASMLLMIDSILAIILDETYLRR